MDIPKILIVDDEDDIRQTLSDYLSKRIECEVIEAADGYKALKELGENRIDLVLLDIKMPGISGIDVMRKVQEISKDIPIIVMTKWEGPEVMGPVKQGGAEYIPKPFSLKVVRAKVEERLKALGKFSAKQPG